MFDRPYNHHAKVPLTCLLFFFLFCTIRTASAQSQETVYGNLVTKVARTDKSTDTTRLLYCRNIADDRLTVYTILEGVVSSATAYRLSDSQGKLYLFSRSIDQHTIDSLKIDFDDHTYNVIFNKHDRYTLFPAAYARLKNDLQKHHRLTAIMNLLNDAIGDYPIADALPLFTFQPNVGKQIKRAQIVTQRSQADLKDKWLCSYRYNDNGLLSEVLAKNNSETRYTKKVRYTGLNVTRMSTYLNIESRQTLTQTINYLPGNQTSFKEQEDAYETGKNRETLSSVSQVLNALGQLRKLEPSFEEVKDWLKPRKINNEQTKSHVD